MAGNERALVVKNQQLANTFSSRGNLVNIGGFISPNGHLDNFMISGGVRPFDRYEPLREVLASVIGQIPVVVIHNQATYMESLAVQTHKNKQSDKPLWVINERNPGWEPFYGMNEMQIIVTLRRLADKLQYQVMPKFERVARAHLSILKILGIPIGLSGLYYLCQFYNMSEFYDNIMQLPCGEQQARQIWADMGIDGGDDSSQFDLFRVIINNLASEAELSGWRYDNDIKPMNCVKALENNATILLSVNDMRSTLILPYLLEELRTSHQRPFMLLFDGVKIEDEDFREYLCKQNPGCICGIVAENVVEMFGGDTETFFRVAARMKTIVLFKHTTGNVANTLAEIFGRYDYTKVETSQGTNRGFFSLLPKDRHNDTRYSTENRYRVMPEAITALGVGQAIVFDTVNDEIIYFN